VCAFVSALMAFVVIGGGGIALAGLQGSGERMPGAAVAVVAGLALGCAMALVFAPRGAFRSGARRALGITSAFVGALPAAALSCAAFIFAGVPWGSRMPIVDWAVFAAGIAFALGALSIVVLGYLRVATPEHVGNFHSTGNDDEVRITRV
jgi:hypothetical protein